MKMHHTEGSWISQVQTHEMWVIYEVQHHCRIQHLSATFILSSPLQQIKASFLDNPLLRIDPLWNEPHVCCCCCFTLKRWCVCVYIRSLKVSVFYLNLKVITSLFPVAFLMHF